MSVAAARKSFRYFRLTRTLSTIDDKVFLVRRYTLLLPSVDKVPGIAMSDGTNSAERKTWRVRNIRNGWDVARLEEYLSRYFGNSSPIIKSLAQEPHGDYLTATVLGRGPTAIQELPDLQFDADFLGMTTLYAPDPGNHLLE